MGRKVKRVATDFRWPLNKVWRGYINPHPYADRCAACDGQGYAPMAKFFHDQWYGREAKFDPVEYGREPYTTQTAAIRDFAANQVDRSIADGTSYYNYGRLNRDEAVEANTQRLLDMWNFQWCHHLNDDDVKSLVDAGRLYEFTHTPVARILNKEEYVRTRAYYLWEQAGRPEGDGKEFWEAAAEEHSGYWLPYQNGYVPTAEEVNNWSFAGFGHDSTNCYVCVKARCEREGYPYLCDVCNGKGHTWHNKEAKTLYDSWVKEEPPVGEGYQIWETVSEGSPISPVFSDPRILAEYMANSKPWGAAQPMSTDDWLKWIVGIGWAPSLVMTNGVMQDGVEAVTQQSGDGASG